MMDPEKRMREIQTRLALEEQRASIRRKRRHLVGVHFFLMIVACIQMQSDSQPIFWGGVINFIINIIGGAYNTTRLMEDYRR